MPLEKTAMDLRQLLAKILNVSADSLSDTSSPENIAAWDSFNGLLIASELEKVSGVTFNINDVMQVHTVGDIRKILERYKVAYDF